MYTDTSIEMTGGFIMEHHGCEEDDELYRLFARFESAGDEDPTVPRSRPEAPACEALAAA